MESFKKLSKYAEAIKNSKKQDPKDFARDLSKKNFDSLIFGGRIGGGGPEPKAAVEVLEELIKNDKISVIGFQGLSYVRPGHIEEIEKFNKGGSAEELMRKLGIMSTYEPLVKFTKEHSIKIAGLEGGKPIEMDQDELRKDLEYYRQMSESTGKLVEENKKDGIVVSYVSQPHVTVGRYP